MTDFRSCLQLFENKCVFIEYNFLTLSCKILVLYYFLFVLLRIDCIIFHVNVTEGREGATKCVIVCHLGFGGGVKKLENCVM